ncbi:MAG: asparagine synthase (glutamine-hydrolyzing) [Gemmatimonadota bacterium]
MCGVAGIAGPSIDAGDVDRVERMVGSQHRRGPDGSGVHRFGSAVMGHTRLAVFDPTDAGRQPMVLEDGRVGVVLNGAIYNFRDLRSELESGGVCFRSRTDTEVLLRGYVVWGLPALVERLHGMFAFALWDDALQSLWLVRDRLGVKPLVFMHAEARLAFASTVTALRAAGLTGDVNPAAIGSYLEYGYVPDGQSIYSGVGKVPPASIVTFRGDRLMTSRYWSPASASVPATFHDAVDATDALLLAATRRRLGADVRVGALLSGGIDSALVCAAAHRLGSELLVFTVAAPGEPEDESEAARATANRLGLRHRVIPADSADFEDVNELVVAYGEPFACSSALGMLLLSRAVAREGIKVMLTGDGGDDLFLGYERHLTLARSQAAARWLPEAASPLWRVVRPLLPDRGAARRLKQRVDVATGGLGAFLSAPDGLPAFGARRLLGPRLLGMTVSARTIPWSVPAARRVLLDYLEHDRREQFVSEYLTKLDGSSMHYGVEARSPFLDQALWEYATKLPVTLHLHDGQTKAILRSLARRLLGDRLATAPKRGFSVPVRAWMAGRWARKSLEVLQDSLLARDGWLDPRHLKQEFERARVYRPAATRLWYLLILELWMRAQSHELK